MPPTNLGSGPVEVGGNIFVAPLAPADLEQVGENAPLCEEVTDVQPGEAEAESLFGVERPGTERRGKVDVKARGLQDTSVLDNSF